ncbi:MAG TPA: hypothetical protein VFY47_15470 [Thermoleophilaceae bacterium]|nr:hypothetical protein [Thermoleophilaceae bacterium]
MKLTRLIVVLAALLSLQVVAAGAASASTAGDCQAQLTTLRGNTVDAQTSFTSQKDFNGLVAKLDAATTKLAAGKNADAVAKLSDFQTTLTLLATAPKPKFVNLGVAEALSTEAQGVINCVNAIGTT